MKTEFHKSFAKDLKRQARDKSLLAHVQKIILEVEAAGDPMQISNLKKLKAEGSYYRIRVGGYRIGLVIENDTVTFVKILNRGEIYRYFP